MHSSIAEAFRGSDLSLFLKALGVGARISLKSEDRPQLGQNRMIQNQE